MFISLFIWGLNSLISPSAHADSLNPHRYFFCESGSQGAAGGWIPNLDVKLRANPEAPTGIPWKKGGILPFKNSLLVTGCYSLTNYAGDAPEKEAGKACQAWAKFYGLKDRYRTYFFDVVTDIDLAKKNENEKAKIKADRNRSKFHIVYQSNNLDHLDVSTSDESAGCLAKLEDIHLPLANLDVTLFVGFKHYGYGEHWYDQFLSERRDVVNPIKAATQLFLKTDDLVNDGVVLYSKYGHRQARVHSVDHRDYCMKPSDEAAVTSDPIGFSIYYVDQKPGPDRCQTQGDITSCDPDPLLGRMVVRNMNTQQEATFAVVKADRNDGMGKYTYQLDQGSASSPFGGDYLVRDLGPQVDSTSRIPSVSFYSGDPAAGGVLLRTVYIYVDRSEGAKRLSCL